LIAALSLGAITFETTFGGTENDEARDVQQTADGGYIVIGSSISYGPSYRDIWLVKTDAYGNQEWDQFFGGAGWDLALENYAKACELAGEDDPDLNEFKANLERMQESKTD